MEDTASRYGGKPTADKGGNPTTPHRKNTLRCRGGGLWIRNIPADIMNKQSGTDDKGWKSSFGVE